MFWGSERGLQRENRNRPVVPCEHSYVQRGPGAAASGDSPPQALRAGSSAESLVARSAKEMAPIGETLHWQTAGIGKKGSSKEQKS